MVTSSPSGPGVEFVVLVVVVVVVTGVGAGPRVIWVANRRMMLLVEAAGPVAAGVLGVGLTGVDRRRAANCCFGVLIAGLDACAGCGLPWTSPGTGVMCGAVCT
jgi:hypothetical protein